MKTLPLLAATGVAGAAVLAGQLTAVDRAPSDTDVDARKAAIMNALDSDLPRTEAGSEDIADVIVFKISGTANYSDPGYRAYSTGTTSCNIGTVPLDWIAGNNRHPVIGQNLYRLAADENGHQRFRHLGQSWLKHGFCALSQNECGPCQSTPCSTLGVWCSDPYTASRNGNQGPAGPKWQVNTTTGVFPYPPADPPYSGNTARRLRVPSDQVVGADWADARWFFEAQYVTQDDAPSVSVEQARNNASYREGNISITGSLGGYIGSTVTEVPAITAWAAADPEVTLTMVDLPTQGTMWVGSRAFDNGDGTWDYEYNVFNLNVDKAAGSIEIPVSAGTAVSDYGFHAPEYHSGEAWDNDAWTSSRDSAAVVFATDDYGDNQNANAIRWGTMYSFTFTADAPPVDGEVFVGIFKPTQSGGFGAAAVVPEAGAACVGDVSGDGLVGFDDLVQVLSLWGDCADCPEDLDGDGVVAFGDLVELLAAWGDCP